jgi:hypothetical protein
MNQFSWKSLSFYGVTIAFVVGLFSFTTAYGETYLKAPVRIDGRYRLSAQNLPGCLKGEALILDLQQSGVYVHGVLIETAPQTKPIAPSKIKPSLSGFWRAEQLTVSGVPTAIKACQTISYKTEVQIQGTIVKQTLKGTIGWGAEQPTPFIADREAEPTATEH